MSHKTKKPFILIVRVCFIDQFLFQCLKTDVAQTFSPKEMLENGINTALIEILWLTVVCTL